MKLPFTRDEFLSVFAAYNRAVWPAALALWATAGVLAGWMLLRRRGGGRGAAAFLSLLWLWTGVVYHGVFFRRINPLAPTFAFFFAGEGAVVGVLARFGRRPRVDAYGPRPAAGRTDLPGLRARWRATASALFLAAAILYPLAAVAAGTRYPRTPTFGVPCPTVLFTVGVFLRSDFPSRELASAVPFIWCILGGSAALLLGVAPDSALLPAGVALAADFVAERRRRRKAARR